MRKKYSILLLKIFLLVLPIIIILLTYIIIDPFKVIFHYNNFFPSGKVSTIALNKDYVSTETFLNNYPEYKYDSFIFGNSRSWFYQVSDWKNYISSDKCFHFDAASESLFGIYNKIKFLDKRHIPVKNAVIVMDYYVLSKIDNSSGYLLIKHPLISGQPWYEFQLEFVKTFFNFKFLYAYIDYHISHKIKNYMIEDGLLSDSPFDYDIKSNEFRLTEYEKLISQNRDKFYIPREIRFIEHFGFQKNTPSVIKEKQIRMLNEIYNILIKDSADFKIVISPLYYKHDFFAINRKDLLILYDIFGKDRVFNFSGENDITTNKYNYYEESHYRPHITRYILSEIYKDKK